MCKYLNSSQWKVKMSLAFSRKHACFGTNTCYIFPFNRELILLCCSLWIKVHIDFVKLSINSRMNIVAAPFCLELTVGAQIGMDNNNCRNVLIQKEISRKKLYSWYQWLSRYPLVPQYEYITERECYCIYLTHSLSTCFRNFLFMNWWYSTRHYTFDDFATEKKFRSKLK